MSERLLRRLNVAGFAFVAACAAAAAASAMNAPPQPPLPALSAAERARIGREFAALEPTLRRRAARDFPGHLWGQSDHFAGMEQDWIRVVARRQRTNIGDVVLAIDEDLRAHPPDGFERLGTAAPCQPLPFYD